MKVVIMTPIPLEFQAVSQHLTNRKPVYDGDRLYEMGMFKGQFHDYEILLVEPGAKVENMAVATQRAIQFFTPAIVLLVGIAGGLKDVTIGDIVIGQKVYGYESGKESEDGFMARPEVQLLSTHLVARAKFVARTEKWKQSYDGYSLKPNVYFGAVAAGNKLMASENNLPFQHIKKHFNDAIAIEMEATGFAKALEGYREIHGLVIRGISDLCKDKTITDAQGNQPLAAEGAAAFAFDLLNETDCSLFIQNNNMDPKTIAKEVFALILPLIKIDAVKGIGTELNEAANNTVTELWKKVKPLFIEELEDLKEDPDDPDNQGAARKKLEKAMSKDETLRTALQAALEKTKASGSGIVVTESKNFIIGGSIKVGGDFRLGDG